MQTIAEFEQAWKGHVNRPLAIVAGLLLLCFYGFFAVGLIQLELHGEEYVTGSAGTGLWPTCVAVTSAYTSLLLTGVVFAMWRRRARRDGRLTCPHCAEFLVPFRRWLKKTRRCGRCGRPALQGAAPVVPKPRAALEAAADRARRALPLRVGCYLAVGLILAVLIVWMFRQMQVYPYSPLRWVGGPLLFEVVCLSLLWPVMRRARPDPMLTCPHCGTAFSGGQLPRRDRCRNCHLPVIADEPAGPPPPG
jgi:hypothetical protein